MYVSECFWQKCVVFMKAVVKLVTTKKAKTEKNVCPDLALVDQWNSSLCGRGVQDSPPFSSFGQKAEWTAAATYDADQSYEGNHTEGHPNNLSQPEKKTILSTYLTHKC